MNENSLDLRHDDNQPERTAHAAQVSRVTGAIERVLSQANRTKVDKLLAQAPSRIQEYREIFERDDRTGRILWTLRDENGALAGAGEASNERRARKDLAEAQRIHYMRLMAVRETYISQTHNYMR